MKKALVFGATGLVGKHLLDLLNESSYYGSTTAITRKEYGLSSGKVKEVIIDFNNMGVSDNIFEVDDIYICLGTTLKKAGSVKNVEEIDRDIPMKIAEIAAKKNVKQLAIISSIGANKNSKNYYLRIKGEMETALLQYSTIKVKVVRPSIILGKRDEQRFAETAGKLAAKALGFLFIGRLKKYKGIHAKTIAKALIKILNTDSRLSIFESDELAKLGK